MREARQYQCFSPAGQTGNHGAHLHLGLLRTPFRSESANVWVGYRDKPNQKYLGVFPSFQHVMDRCRINEKSNSKSAFPHFVRHQHGGHSWQSDSEGRHFRKVCCVGCSKHDGSCEVLTLEFIPVESPSGKAHKVYLLAYCFHLRNDRMVALVHHSSRGKHYFQKTDGSLSKTMGLDSRHRCTSVAADRGNDDDSSDASSLTEFDSAEEEIVVAQARLSPRNQQRVSLQPTSKNPALFSQTKGQQTPSPPQPQSRGLVVVDLTENDDSPIPIKQEFPSHPDQVQRTALYSPPSPSSQPASLQTPAPSVTPSGEDSSFLAQYRPDPLAEEYGRMTSQLINEYSMRLFTLPEVSNLINLMRHAVKRGDRAALCTAYGALQAFLVSIE